MSWYKKIPKESKLRYKEVLVFNLKGELEMTLEGFSKDISSKLNISPSALNKALKRGSVLNKKWFVMIKKEEGVVERNERWEH